MKCKILHESNGRMRLHAEQTRMTLRQADILPGTSPLEQRMKEMMLLNLRWFMQTLLDSNVN